MNEPHPVRWRSMIGLGFMSVLVGLFMLFFTDAATRVIVSLAGLVVIMLSLVFIVEGLCIETEGWPRWLTLGIGLFGLIGGIASVALPSLITITSGLLLGAFLIIYGIGEMAIGIGVVFAESMVRMIFVMLGIFSIIIGLFLALNPARGVDILISLVGFYLLVLGLMRVAHGLNERDLAGKAVVKRL